ncbi:MAG: hypothetical protein FJ398_08550 [Verrucomicrobia bacterium]|nr:hypothetical protein [Verrucomicrobiota bacterium]
MQSIGGRVRRPIDKLSLNRALRAWFLALAAFVAACGMPHASAQIPAVVFTDDFSSNTIDPAKYQPDAPFFEGGKGDIHAEAGNGVFKFVGTTSQQWWSGGTLRITQTFEATEQTPVKITIDRVAEAGVGTASRSALWILNEEKDKYVLFADVRGEGGWRFNRKIGETGDVPTGSGTDIAAFNGGTFDDGGLHRMQMVANGSTVKLILDGIQGPEVKFPFSKVIFQFGSYARANNDTADTTWDNLKIETNLKTSVVFSDDFSSNTLPASKYEPDAPFFEGGKGDIHAEAGNGVLKFVGTTSQQWWSGGTVRVVPAFTATQETPVSISIDRVAEAGVGTASRSALWILNEAKDKYVLFADVRGEGGWRFNRKIGETGDVPTGSGTDIAAFNGGSFDNGQLHRMQIIADGKTVKLLLDGIQGAEVKFPFSKVIFEIGSYARANNDTADTTWDNLRIETVVRKTSVVFADDFAANTIDPAKYQPDAPFFEGGKGDIHAEAGNGVLKFVGTTSQQWWSGGTLRIVPTFAPSEGETITLSIDRVAEAGVGTASRSALWILNEAKDKYVLFADVRGEGGWRFNRKIGETGDVPTGSGTDIAAFNGAAFDDGGLHRMSMIADGKTVKLLLDGIQGTEVKFPFSPVVFEFGSYARANNDTADTTWDNLRIETAGGTTFSPTAMSVRVGQLSPPVTLRIPQGLNSQAPVQVRVVSSDANLAVPDGGTGASLNVTFPAGGANTATFRIRGAGLGTVQFAAEGDLPGANRLAVAVISGPGVVLEESFAGATIDTAKWQISNRAFEVGTGTYTVTQTGGQLNITGAGDSDFWSGASLKTAKSYVATKDINLAVEVDRVSNEQVGTAGRTGVFITNGDRSRFVFFAHNLGENGWQVNVNPGNPTGGGSNLAAFNDLDLDPGRHKMKLVADGSMVEVFLNGVSGGRFPFEVTSDIYVEFGAYARATGDLITGKFDNARIEYVLPCSSFSERSVSMTLAVSGKPVSVTIPQLLNDAASATVTVTSRNPGIAIPSGAVNGVLTLNFAAGSPNTQTITVTPVGLGSTTFEIATSPANCAAGSLGVEVVSIPQVLLTDDFTASTIDATKWVLDQTPFQDGAATAESALTIANGQVKIDVTAETATWPGFALVTAKTYTASATAPVTFEVDRVLLDFVLVTGTGARQRTGIWIKEPGGNFLFFSDHAAWDGNNFGWRYNKVTGQADDNPNDAGINIAAFDPAQYNDQKNHRVKMVANGATVKLYVDDVFGAEVAFPFAQGLTFGFGAYVQQASNVVRGYFDNARITGGSAPLPPKLTAVLQSGNVVISWTGDGTLQSTDSLVPANWQNVTPAPTGKSITTSASAGARFYRLRQ